MLVVGWHIVLKGRWLNIFVLNVLATSEEETDDSEDNFKGIRAGLRPFS